MTPLLALNDIPNVGLGSAWYSAFFVSNHRQAALYLPMTITSIRCLSELSPQVSVEYCKRIKSNESLCLTSSIANIYLFVVSFSISEKFLHSATSLETIPLLERVQNSSDW